MRSDIQIGDMVGYSRNFLKSIACYTGNLPRAKGKVTAMEPFGESFLATIEWDLPRVPKRVHVNNLARVGTRNWAD